MRGLASLFLIVPCLAALASGSPPEREDGATLPPHGVTLFELHDPSLAKDWTRFLDTTPMLNAKPLPDFLRDRLTNDVAIYRSLTPPGQPAFFVATYFDVLSEHLLTANPEIPDKIRPMQVCPVFTSGRDASVSSLLAAASGLPAELFVNAPGRAERYRSLFLHTEYSHCRVLATIRSVEGSSVRVRTGEQDGERIRSLTFKVGTRACTANLSTKEELRALVETVGDVDAIAGFNDLDRGGRSATEVEVFVLARLLSLLATDGNNGYAAIPVLAPLLAEVAGDANGAQPFELLVADGLNLAYKVRKQFRRHVPFAIRDTQDLLTAQQIIMRLLSEDGVLLATDPRLRALLQQFVTGVELLLAPPVAEKRMPPIRD